MTHDFDLVVVGHETEGCLAAIAAARAGAKAAIVAPADAMWGGLLTEDGLAFVDRDARHLVPPTLAPEDGIFGEFLARAGVPLVALPASVGDATLVAMLREAGVEVIAGEVAALATHAPDRLAAVQLASGEAIAARHFIDATPDADMAELAGMRFVSGFSEYGVSRTLGVSPLPLVEGVSPETIMATCERLQADPALEALKVRVFGDRRFLELDRGDDYLLVGPPHLGLAYQRWREAEGLESPYPFEADGFNVAIVGPEATSWNGLIYFSEDPEALLRLSREGADAVFQEETRRFERFLREGLGWRSARVSLPPGVYVRQTRHALDVRHRLTLDEIASGYDHGSVGTFCYYPDFRGFRAVAVPGPVTAHVILEAGLASGYRNLGLATRAGGYTPFAHSICRLVQYNVTLGAALGVAAALAAGDLGEVPAPVLKEQLGRLALLSDDPAGLDRNPPIRSALAADPVIRLEQA